MPNITERLCSIERLAERAIVQELRLMTQEILAMRTQLSLEHRAHADGLLLKLDHLERCQLVDMAAPATPAADGSPAVPDFPVLPFDTLELLQPSHYLVHFYDHEAGDLDRVALAETLAAAAQLVRLHLDGQPRPVWQVTHCATTRELALLGSDDRVLANILPCEPSTPDVDPALTEACAALAAGDPMALRRLFVATPAQQLQRLAA